MFRYELRATGWGPARHKTLQDAIWAALKAEDEGRGWYIRKRRFGWKTVLTSDEIEARK